MPSLGWPPWGLGSVEIGSLEGFLDLIMCPKHLEDLLKQVARPPRLSVGLGRGLRTYTFSVEVNLLNVKVNILITLKCTV